jgi:hypothetical protein
MWDGLQSSIDEVFGLKARQVGPVVLQQSDLSRARRIIAPFLRLSHACGDKGGAIDLSSFATVDNAAVDRHRGSGDNPDRSGPRHCLFLSQIEDRHFTAGAGHLVDKLNRRVTKRTAGGKDFNFSFDCHILFSLLF